MKCPFGDACKPEYEIYKPGMKYNAVPEEDDSVKTFFLKEVRLGGYGFSRRQLVMFVAVNLSLIALALCFILTPKMLWFIPVAAVFLSAALVIYGVSDKRSFLRNIRRAAGLWCVALLLMQYFLFRGDWAVDYAIPSVVVAFDCYLAVLFFKSRSKLPSLVLSASLMLAHTIYPLVLFSLGFTCGSLAAKAFVFTALILTLALIANLAMFWLFSIKSKIKEKLQ